MPQTMKQYLNELKIKDPDLYNEIISETEKEIEEIRKWSGKRPNSGCKKSISKNTSVR